MKHTVIFLSVALALNASAATQPQTIVQNPQAGGIAVQNTGTLTIIQYDLEIVKKLGVTEEKLKVTEVAFHKFLEIAGEKKVPIEQLPTTMEQMAERYKSALQGVKNLENSDDPEIKKLIQQAEQLLREKVDLDQAEKLLNQAHTKKKDKKARLKEMLHKEEVEQAAISFQTGQVKFTQLKYKEAGEYYRRAVEELPKDEETLLADYLNSAIKSMHYNGKYAQATPLAEQALQIREKVLGAEHPDVAQSLNNLAALYDSQGKYGEAEPLHLRTLDILEKVHGKEHPLVATSLNNLAALYDSQGKYAQAEPLHLRALEIREKVLGVEHPDVAQSLNNLANLYLNQGKYRETESLYLRALEIRENILGKEHPDVAQSLNNLAALYDDQGKYEQAEPLYVRALEIDEKILGKDHPKTQLHKKNYEKMKKKWQKKQKKP